ncbi:alginate lyase family protein [Pontixanthobacter aestiaquae]|uniref:Alginate lyase n=1 Tax=Pontixanthobacter aestiaquae TaxID=1509367 RepID=A0A844Z6H4_9SPHN|nr:alginate lyase family protein [Pontixanthobacter aestiaquae]MDN3644752.1 alginate lyase family protein [Pontixanthobacter aestiaquae]MXO84241.1 alginate lyase [Pontixanthobacter aestiaquae]
MAGAVIARCGVSAFSAGLAALLLAAPALAQSATVPAYVPPAEGPVCDGAQGYSASFDGRRTFLWRPQWLESIRASALADESEKAKLVGAADKVLRGQLYSVTDKPRPVPGAGKNDYASIGPYWWPDPKKRDGLPYIRRDGEVNPERDGPEFDKDRLRDLANDLETLSIAYFVTEDGRYADRAAHLVRTWFLDPATRMNPHMNFAQGIPGKVNGRGEGIIEASDLSTIVETVGLIEPSGALSKEERGALRKWYADYAAWMATSDLGEDEMNKRNNHGVFYDFYLAHFALFAGLEGATASVVDSFPRYRLGVQMDKQGRFIEELKRTRSWHYSIFVVDGAARLATIAECVNRDLWNATLPDGRSLGTAQGFLAKYADTPSQWPFPDTDKDRERYDRMASKYASLAVLLERGAVEQGAVKLP